MVKKGRKNGKRGKTPSRFVVIGVRLFYACLNEIVFTTHKTHTYMWFFVLVLSTDSGTYMYTWCYTSRHKKCLLISDYTGHQVLAT